MPVDYITSADAQAWLDGQNLRYATRPTPAGLLVMEYHGYGQWSVWRGTNLLYAGKSLDEAVISFNRAQEYWDTSDATPEAKTQPQGK